MLFSQHTRKIFTLLVLTCCCYTASANNDQKINKTLNTFHQAAAQANFNLYFQQLSDNAIFLGTDPHERWTKKQFKAYVKPMFAKGQGWLDQSLERHISISADQQTAFFDETLSNKNYGICRGSGILHKTAQGWKISQYNLSVPLPNAIAKGIVKQIKDYQQQKLHAKN